jgi:hypothetical protein
VINAQGAFKTMSTMLFDIFVGMLTGAIVLMVVSVLKRLFSQGDK